jgi:lysophospholipase L1-like esterase
LEKYGELLQPSLLIASFNYNDRGFVYERIDSDAKFADYYSSRSALNEFLRHVYTVRLLQSVMVRIGLVRREKPVPNVDVRSLKARVPPDEYRANLRKIAEYGKAHNIPVIFMLLRDNPVYVDLIRQGIAYREQGDYEAAIRYFSFGLNNIVSGTLARKYLAETYAEMGLHDKAERAGEVPKMAELVGGRNMIYLDSVYHQVMIEAGQELGVKVVDARPFLDTPLRYLDACHPDEAGHAQIAKMMLKAIQEVAPEIAHKGSRNGTY